MNASPKNYTPLNAATDLDALLTHIGDSNIVMLGEASHGTHEYYTWRAKISKRLIEEKGFTTVVVEGDWPPCYEVNRYIKNYAYEGKTPQEVLASFKRWPTWMWGNWETVAFISWLKKHNDKKIVHDKIGFYGMDLYSLWESLEIMVDYLEAEDTETAQLAKKAFSCFEPFQPPETYTTVFREGKSDCQKEVLELLEKVRLKSHSYDSQYEAGLNAEMNALVSANAELYYKAMALFEDSSWNVRDRHMIQTLNTIQKYHPKNGKTIVWAHNTHIGDARATNMADHGLINIGQLARQQFRKDNVTLVGFGGYQGSVLAGEAWGAPMQRMDVPPSKEGSFEHYLHNSIGRDALLIFNKENKFAELKDRKIGHRAIGVVYNPQFERNNYVPTLIADRYDAFLYFETTQALHPLRTNEVETKEPNLYPFGL